MSRRGIQLACDVRGLPPFELLNHFVAAIQYTPLEAVRFLQYPHATRAKPVCRVRRVVDATGRAVTADSHAAAAATATVVRLARRV